METELWMKNTGVDFTNDYDFFSSTIHFAGYTDCLGGFDQFIYAHYNVEMGAKNGRRIILENSLSEAEAFDKYYELLDIFFDEQRKKGLLPPNTQ